MIRDVFRARDICKVLSLSSSRYDYIKKKFELVPDLKNLPGSGQNHEFSYNGLLRFGMAHYMNKCGFSDMFIYKVINRDELSGKIVEKRSLFYQDFDLDELKKEVDIKIKEFYMPS